MSIKVISFNIRCVDDENGNSIQERAPRLSMITTPYDADVIGFQEYTPFWEDSINRYFCDKYEFFNKVKNRTAYSEQELEKIYKFNKKCYLISFLFICFNAGPNNIAFKSSSLSIILKLNIGDIMLSKKSWDVLILSSSYNSLEIKS